MMLVLFKTFSVQSFGTMIEHNVCQLNLINMLNEGNLNASYGLHKASRFTINYSDWCYTRTSISTVVEDFCIPHAFVMYCIALRNSLENPSAVYFSHQSISATNIHPHVAHALFRPAQHWMFIIATHPEYKSTKTIEILFSYFCLIIVRNKNNFHLFLCVHSQPFLNKQT